MRHSMIGFEHIFSFLAKEMLEPMRPLVTTPQGRLVEALVSTKLKKLLNVKSYTEMRNATDL